ncbi:MAG: RelA/SpoT domain-containing protein [Actinobacteria bacterium]|uniref:RelA/SpoT domain-containing protein n=1 Tax=Nostocoides veronense TaxID=330836 RepID=A0ABP4XI90_9MICO|nr:RelA/SpoT domain-containing protein [Actinomycetota bacterium]
MGETPTNSQVKKAGSTVRRFFRGADGVDLAAFNEALRVIEAWRASHAGPLVSANNGLRSMLRTEGCEINVSQRLKRMQTILNKLTREPTLSLPTMQDIGGVRAVIGTIPELRRVEQRLVQARGVSGGYSDYISEPRESGYRGVHVVVTYGDPPRHIEVQLRTPMMHEWAITVERLSNVFGETLKADRLTPSAGPAARLAHRFMAEVSRAQAIEEVGGVTPGPLRDTIARLRLDIEAYIGQGR